ncbi:MAG TPA: hypothetical protein VFD46_09120 [Chryseolinea sp.]|nr:hypothetical protein [Chryseolinea sp.]
MKRLVPILRVSFFILIFWALCMRCQPAEEHTSVTVVSKNGKAVAVVIRGSFIKHESISTLLKVQLIKPGERLPVLGDFRKEGNEVIFEPVVPLTKGLTYEVLLNDSLLSEIEIPVSDSASPELLSIYPSQDTLPENLLKMYFEFSEPMVEGSSTSHLSLIRNDRDTMHGTFLDLQPELWNAEGTVLTLWLDPGRIKRGLIPNEKLGLPLKAAERYTLHLNKLWKSKNGVPLAKNYSKTFVVVGRDDDFPDLATWKLLTPSLNEKEALEIKFPQSLDYFLVTECITIRKSNGDIVTGKIEMADEERILRFVPDQPWTKGSFALKVESRLEDLAGNNLNHPFDREVNKKNVETKPKIFTKEFEIQE